MRILWFCFLVHSIYAQSGFGTSYLKDSKLCRPWTCINEKLGLRDALPPRDQYATVLKSLLPEGAWQSVVGNVLDTCYGERPRRYTNTCPGQALMHCMVDQLIQNCPEENWNKEDACAPLTTLAGFRYMFSQSRYENLETNIPKERRPSWFLRNYFSSRCCDLPVLLNATALSECGFSTTVYYYKHTPKNDAASFSMFQKHTTTTQRTDQVGLKIVDFNINKVDTTPKHSHEAVRIVDFPEVTATNNKVDTTPKHSHEAVRIVDFPEVTATNNKLDTTPKHSHEAVRIVDFPEVTATNGSINPLECCDLSGFIEPWWTRECDFHLTWQVQERLTIADVTHVTTTAPPATTPKPVRFHDVKIVPHSCENETCVFRKLNIVSESGTVDLDAFLRLLDNLTSAHPSWTKAKGRVITQCLARPFKDYLYPDRCEINRLLACTFDVLTENCPHASKEDPCKHTKNNLDKDITCQVSSSKYRPKHRRLFCGLPHLVSHDILSQCGLTSESRMEFVPDTPKFKKPTWIYGRSVCKDSAAPTKCLMKKMGVLNKYGFMDYFKIKDKVRSFCSDEAWAPQTDSYLSAVVGVPLYHQHCSSSKKLLNAVDAMLRTCPISKRKPTVECSVFFTSIANTPITTDSELNRVTEKLKIVSNGFLRKNRTIQTHEEDNKLPSSENDDAAMNLKNMAENHRPMNNKKIHINPIFDFGILGSKNVPAVRIIDVKPEVKPLVLLPVYLRMNGTIGTFSIRPFNNDSVLRNGPFSLYRATASIQNFEGKEDKPTNNL